ncbi:uncharacterized protein LOC131890495 isoform X2 [Tigriopus californicus]|uniref:uncharacterized protein LOC131890495 isoform X2 n=1 Tax=Tigriopus californicus TaxID=6832 RepID=UPI0027D9F51A|nr:uncharacterized protein LOC131890495 isoform X2 [Tigriopus californicus]
MSGKQPNRGLGSWKPQIGRHLIAIRDIPAGKVIFSESPLAQGPSPDHPNDDDICIICLSELEHPKVCSNCFWPVCSSECGRSSRHKMECATLAACARESEEDLLPLRHLLVMRCLQMKHRDQYSWEKLLDMEDHHGVQTLIRNIEDELSDMDRMELKYFIRESCGMGIKSELDIVADIVQSSSIQVECELQEPFPAVYLTGGLLAQACVPNTVLRFDRDQKYLLSAFSGRKIAKGEKLTFCPLKNLIRTGTRERRRKLNKRLINCFCDRCTDPTECQSHSSAFICQKCPPSNHGGQRPGVILPRNPMADESEWACQICNYTMTSDTADKLLHRLRDSLEATKCEDSEVKFKDFLRTNRDILHPNHYLMVACKESLFNLKTSDARALDISIADKLEAVDLGLDLLKLVDILEPGLSEMRGKLLLTLGTTLQEMLSQEIMNRMESPDQAELDERHIYSAFHDALFCFEEAKKIQRLNKTAKGREVYSTIKSSIHVLKDMKRDFEKSYNSGTN